MIQLRGRVLRGAGYGRKLGFPTANLDRRQFARLQQPVRLGIYAGIVQIDNKARRFPAGIVIGPKDANGLPKIEAHLLGFRGNLYGKRLTLQLIEYLRPFRSYATESSLRQVISQDMKQVAKFIRL